MQLPTMPPLTDDEAEALIRQHPNPHFAEALIEMYGRLRRSLPVVNAWLGIAAAIRNMDENPPEVLSQFIARLQALQAEHGDVPVYVVDPDYGRSRIATEYRAREYDGLAGPSAAGPGVEIFSDME